MKKADNGSRTRLFGLGSQRSTDEPYPQSVLQFYYTSGKSRMQGDFRQFPNGSEGKLLTRKCAAVKIVKDEKDR